MDAVDLMQVDCYIAPNGAVCDAPKGLEEDAQGRLYLNRKAVNVEGDGKLAFAPEDASEQFLHRAAPTLSDVMQRRVSRYIAEPDFSVVEVGQRAVLSQAPDGGIFYNGKDIADRRIVPIVEAENKTFLARPDRQEVEIVGGKAIPVVDRLNLAVAADVGEELRPAAKIDPLKGEGEYNIHQGANPVSSFLENFLRNYRVALKKMGMKENIVDVKDLISWEEAEKMGLTRDFLQKEGRLEKMLQGKKTDLLPIAIADKDSGVTINTYARLSLKQDDEGKIHFKANLLRNDLDLTQYCGHALTSEDKASLQRTGNLGRIIEVKFKGDENPKKIFLSLDRQTNELIAFDAEKVKIPTAIAGKELTVEQQQALREGKSVKVEGMKSAAGGEFSNTLQFSAVEKRFVFTNNIPKVGRKIAGVELSDEQRGKIISGEVVQIVGMTDKAGKKYNAYVRWNPDEKRLNFSSTPSFTRKKTPTNEHKTQVAANNDGHKPEALKNVKGAVEQKQPNTLTAAQAKTAKPQKRMKM
ncbi:MAG: DUF3945 domain-containing protein [Prevotellaceae bacterium]|jgi:hypothetical protein|nr:DUF3945 domain-containing protein [Prevotellaceae bacterium]